MISRFGLGGSRAGAAAATIAPAASAAVMRSEVVRVMERSLLWVESIDSLRRRGELYERRLGLLVRRDVTGDRCPGRAEVPQIAIDRTYVPIAHVAHVEPRHRRAQLAPRPFHPLRLAHRLRPQPEVGGVRRPPRAAPTERTPSEPDLLVDLAVRLRITRRVAVVAARDL